MNNFYIDVSSFFQENPWILIIGFVSGLFGIVDFFLNHGTMINFIITRLRGIFYNYFKYITFAFMATMALEGWVYINDLKNHEASLQESLKENARLKIENSTISKLKAEIEELTKVKAAIEQELTQKKGVLKTDYLKEWEIQTKERLERCGQCKSDQPQNCSCKKDTIIETISIAPFPNGDTIPKYDSNSSFDNTLRFNRIGYIYLVYAHDLLKTDLGINRNTFNGSGITSPYTNTKPIDSFGSIGIPEYWGPNKSDDDKAVITCNIENPSIEDTNQTVEELLGASKNKTLKKSKCKNQDQVSQAIKFLKDKERPTLFRCSKFPKEVYKHTVGRLEAKRVFFSPLDDVLNLPLSKACTKTGRDLSGTASGQTLFIWIFIPDDPMEVVPATWERLINNFSMLDK